MTPVTKWLRRKAEEWIEKYYEGPEPPERFALMAIEFANLYPTATREQWVAFATEQARGAYRSGYMRGFEYVERDPSAWRPDLPPEILADMIDPDWRTRPVDRGIMYPEAVPVDAHDEAQQTIHFIKETARAAWDRMRARITR